MDTVFFKHPLQDPGLQVAGALVPDCPSHVHYLQSAPREHS
jgi:hypothetical protein